MSDDDLPSADDLAALGRISQYGAEHVAALRRSGADTVEYALALAMAARSFHKTIARFEPDKPGELARYERLGRLIQELLKE